MTAAERYKAAAQGYVDEYMQRGGGAEQYAQIAGVGGITPYKSVVDRPAETWDEKAEMMLNKAAWATVKEVQPLLSEQEALISGRIRAGDRNPFPASSRAYRAETVSGYRDKAKLYDLAAQVYEGRNRGEFWELQQRVKKGIQAAQAAAGTYQSQAAASQEASAEAALQAEAGLELTPYMAAAAQSGKEADWRAQHMMANPYNQFFQGKGPEEVAMYRQFRSDIIEQGEKFNPYEYLRNNPESWRFLLQEGSPFRLQGLGFRGTDVQASMRLGPGQGGYARTGMIFTGPGGRQPPGQTALTDEQIVQGFFEQRAFEAQQVAKGSNIMAPVGPYGQQGTMPFDAAAAETRQGLEQVVGLGSIYEDPTKTKEFETLQTRQPTTTTRQTREYLQRVGSLIGGVA